MEFSYLLSGGAPIIKKFQVGETMANPGVPVLKGGSNNEGIALCSTTAAVGVVGFTLDTATLATAQTASNSDPAAYVSVIINPLAVFRAKLSGAATENTALTKYPVTTLSSTGLVVTTATDWTSPESDEGLIYGYDGANTGIGRKITSTSSTAATLLVALPNDTVVGDNFLRVPFISSPYGYETQYPTLTTNLYQIDASVAVTASPVNFRVVEIEMRDSTGNGTTNSFAYIMANGHVFAAGLAV